MSFSLISCDPARYDDYEEIKPNETAFVIPLEGASKKEQDKLLSLDFLEAKKVATKRINIPLVSKSTGRYWFSYQWKRAVKIIKVDRTPQTREWVDVDTKGTTKGKDGIDVESKDSVNFWVGVTCTASVLEEDAAKFLYYYAGVSLNKVIDTNVRGYVQAVLSREFGNRVLEDCRKEKSAVIKLCREETVPHFKEKGITISVLGMTMGLNYVDKEIQTTINDKFVSENSIQIAKNMKKEQDEINTKKRTIADTNLYEARQFKLAQAAATEKIKLEIQRMEAEALLLAAEKWNGSTPSSILPQGSKFLFGLDAK